MIRLDRVEKTYTRGDEEIVACRVASLEVAEGEQVAIVGRSGSGKTTLLHLVSGLLRPDRGRIEVAGIVVTDLGERARDRFRARHVGYVHQTFQLLSGFTAVENVELGAFFAGRRALPGRARDLLERVGLGDRMLHRPSELSVGQQQRVAIARGLVNEPDLLLADEPLGNQDSETGRRVLELMLGLAEELGTTVLIVTHDRETAVLMHRTVSLPELAHEVHACGS